MFRRSLLPPVAAVSLTIALVSAPWPAARNTVVARESSSEAPEYTWTVLEDRLTMRPDFNALKGKVRVIVFFSPTCPQCLKNAGLLQTQFLQKNDSDDIRMMIVWVNSLSTDSQEKLPLAIDVIPDPRVTHYWDEERVLNAQLIDAVAFPVHMKVYDVFLLYDKKATWEKRLPRPGHFFHEIKQMPGPWWNLQAFLGQIQRALDDKPYTSPW